MDEKTKDDIVAKVSIVDNTKSAAANVAGIVYEAEEDAKRFMVEADKRLNLGLPEGANTSMEDNQRIALVYALRAVYAQNKAIIAQNADIGKSLDIANRHYH